MWGHLDLPALGLTDTVNPSLDSSHVFMCIAFLSCGAVKHSCHVETPKLHITLGPEARAIHVNWELFLVFLSKHKLHLAHLEMALKNKHKHWGYYLDIETLVSSGGWLKKLKLSFTSVKNSRLVVAVDLSWLCFVPVSPLGIELRVTFPDWIWTGSSGNMINNDEKNDLSENL